MPAAHPFERETRKPQESKQIGVYARLRWAPDRPAQAGQSAADGATEPPSARTEHVKLNS